MFSAQETLLLLIIMLKTIVLLSILFVCVCKIRLFLKR